MSVNPETAWLDQINWNPEGLIPVIAQEEGSGVVLMHAWMNKDALLQTVQKRQAVYWSRSRGKLWTKGEISGHFQQVKNIFMDCDNDTLILVVHQAGGIACHTGRHSCFYKKLDNNTWIDAAPVIKAQDEIYEK